MTRNESQREALLYSLLSASLKKPKTVDENCKREIEAAKILISESRDTSNEKRGM